MVNKWLRYLIFELWKEERKKKKTSYSFKFKNLLFGNLKSTLVCQRESKWLQGLYHITEGENVLGFVK